MQPPARKVPPSPNANRAETVYIQRIWRGIRARRHFSDLFIVAVEAILGPELTPTPSLYDYDDEIPKSPRHDSPSLEEAQREASYNPSVSCFAHVEASSSRSARRSIAGMPSGIGADWGEISAHLKKSVRSRKGCDKYHLKAQTLILASTHFVDVKKIC